jgi:SPW repeat-containing protein
MATHSTESHIDTHPDLVALRERYAVASARPTTGVIEGLCMLTGLYLAISPWVIGFQGTAPALRVSNLITGLALAVLGMGFGSVLERTHGLGWVASAIGVWTIIAPWVVSGNESVFKNVMNNSWVGGVACALGLATMGIGLMKRRSDASSRRRSAATTTTRDDTAR